MESTHSDRPPTATVRGRSTELGSSDRAALSHASSSAMHPTSPWDGLEASQEPDPGWSTLHPSSRLASENTGMLSIGGQSYDNHMETPVVMAVSHLPQAVHHHQHLHLEPAIFPVSDLLNAAFNDARPSYRSNALRQRLDDPVSSSPPTGDANVSESEMTDLVSDDEGVPLRPYLSGGDDEVESIVQQLGVGLRHTITPDGSPVDGRDDALESYPSMRTRDMSAAPRTVDETDDVLVFYPYDEDRYDQDSPASLHGLPDLVDIDFDDFYRGYDYDSTSQASDSLPPFNEAGQDGHDHATDGEGIDGDGAGDPHVSTFSAHGTTHERNLTIDQFIRHWLSQSSHPSLREFPTRQPTLTHPLACQYWDPPPKTLRPLDYADDFYDLQQIPWWDALRVRRSDARALRDAWYTSYHNLEYSPHKFARRLLASESYFREKAMYTNRKATVEHFQLRNLMSVVSYDTVHFASDSRLCSWIPAYDDLTCLIDLSSPAAESCFASAVKISSMCSRHELAVVGGFNGEYAMRAPGVIGDPGVEGFVTKDFNGITNHIDIIRHRTSRAPTVVFSSNDKHLRILDSETNRFVADHTLSRAINCTATSDDGRLRVVIGDSPDAWVIEADSGHPVQPLRGHRDFGFACAWSPDMRHIATGNQDKTVLIWDTRTWRVLETIESDVAGYRSLHFSPVGGGPRTLLMCEPADRISIVNAQTFDSRQVHDFFGEIGGADYSPDGGSIWVANTDCHFGGFMEYDRQSWSKRAGSGDLPNDWLSESDLDDDPRCVLSARERQLRCLRTVRDEEYDDLLL